ncbi:hypothetical protein L5515_016305 [Caenorhabditis briggsae]|uniref:Homeobox domain-containing protein n=1 Tax=Caenorhabditis briggsae TaxID=6238 RepID=A0AAE9FCH2_CAEBR|nr:hypothetical protein L5515_016305 [Caenorhabditis briggsae]
MVSNQIDLSAADVSQVLNFYQQEELERQAETANAFSVKFLGNRKIHMQLLAFIPNPIEQNRFADVMRVSGTAKMENGVLREFLSYDGTVTMKNTTGLVSNGMDEDLNSQGRASVEFLETVSRDKNTTIEHDQVLNAAVKPEDFENVLDEERPETITPNLGTVSHDKVTPLEDDQILNAPVEQEEYEHLMDEMERTEEANCAPFVSNLETFLQDEVTPVEEDQVSTAFVKPENCNYSLNEQERSETTSDSTISNLETCSYDKSESLEEDQVLNASVEPVKCEKSLDEEELAETNCDTHIPNLNSPQSLHLPPKFSNYPSPGFKSSNPPSEPSNEPLASESLKMKDVCGLLPEPTRSSSDAEDRLLTQPEDLHPQLTSQNREITLHPMSYMNFMNVVNQKNGQFNGLNLINLPQQLQSLLYSNNNVINNCSPIEKQNETSAPPAIEKPTHYSPPKSHPVALCPPKPIGPLSKKPRRQRTTFTSDQLDSFEILFAANPYPSFERKEYLAQKYSLAPERISIWFKNRRAKQKSINSQMGEGPQSSIVREIKLEIPDEEYVVKSTPHSSSGIVNQSAQHRLLTNPCNQTDAIKLGSFPYIGTPTPQISFFGNRLQMIKPHQSFGTPKPTGSILNPLNHSYYVK